MSFFNKIKQGLGLGTLDAKLNVPAQITGTSGQFEGDFSLTAKSDQQIKEIKVKFEKVLRWDETKFRRDSNGHEERYTAHESQTFELGVFDDKTPFGMKANEAKTVHFVVQFQPFNPLADAQKVANQSGVAAVLGVVADIAAGRRNERTEYRVEGKVDLKDVMFDPSDAKDVFVV